MDLISHGLLGYVIGKGLKLDKATHIVLIVSCVAPDIDSVSIIAGWEALFQFHRGITHTFLFAVLASVVITVVYAVVTKPSRRKGLLILLVCVGGTFSHLLLDLLTPWEMAVLWPFLDNMIAYDITYFFDPVFFITFFLASLFVYKKNKNVRIIMVVAVVVVLLNFGVRYYERESAIDTVGLSGTDVMALPTIRPDKWWVVEKVVSERGYVYHVYGVDSINAQVLDETVVESQYTLHSEPVEFPIDSPQEAVAYSRQNQKVKSYIKASRLPAAKVEYTNGVWHVFWYDVFSQLSGGVSRGLIVTVEMNGTLTVSFFIEEPV